MKRFIFFFAVLVVVEAVTNEHVIVKLISASRNKQHQNNLAASSNTLQTIVGRQSWKAQRTQPLQCKAEQLQIAF